MAGATRRANRKDLAALKISSRFESLTVDRPDMWTPAQANKAASANQLPA
jgi:hypothetical protein